MTYCHTKLDQEPQKVNNICSRLAEFTKRATIIVSALDSVHEFDPKVNDLCKISTEKNEAKRYVLPAEISHTNELLGLSKNLEENKQIQIEFDLVELNKRVEYGIDVQKKITEMKARFKQLKIRLNGNDKIENNLLMVF